jgi:hypothetical protein
LALNVTLACAVWFLEQSTRSALVWRSSNFSKTGVALSCGCHRVCALRSAKSQLRGRETLQQQHRAAAFGALPHVGAKAHANTMTNGTPAHGDRNSMTQFQKYFPPILLAFASRRRKCRPAGRYSRNRKAVIQNSSNPKQRHTPHDFRKAKWRRTSRTRPRTRHRQRRPRRPFANSRRRRPRNLAQMILCGTKCKITKRTQIRITP